MPTSPTLRDRVLGCWLGKSIGGTLGLPAEGRRERLGFTYYDPVPQTAPPNDDLELQLVWLHLLESTRGRIPTRADFAQAWLNHIHYMWDEYGICRWNLRRGVPPGTSGIHNNPFTSGMGSPIRSEIWACIHPGDAASAAHLAALDASLDHGVEGIAGEVLFAAAQSLVLAGQPALPAIVAALDHLPASCATARAVRLVLDEHRSRTDPWEARARLLQHHGHANFTHAPLNVALTVWALAAGDGDFGATVLHAVNGGYDTDCTAATAGAFLGLQIGASAIPEPWSKPIGAQVHLGPGILGIDAPADLDALTDRTLALQGTLPRSTWGDVVCDPRFAPVDEARLPGCITSLPTGASAGVPWSNGDLPRAVKAAGGASWTWTKTDDRPLRLLALAPAGIRVTLDGTDLLTCPPGLDFVPAPHRAPPASRRRIDVPAGKHHVAVVLGSSDPDQPANVTLTEANLHLTPWDETILPWQPRLPEPTTS